MACHHYLKKSLKTKAFGYTYVELLVALLIASLLIAGLMGVVGTASDTGEDVGARNELVRDARFAMQRMVHNVSHSPKLLLPLNDNPNTNWRENVREQTIPASAPIGDSTKATAVLAVTLPHDVDLNDDGFPDADDDADGKIDEDLPNDAQHDFANGIIGIDDDGDGSVDEGAFWFDDDEDGSENEDPIDGIDNDGDGSIDEDPPSDMNNDGCPGNCGVDEDGSGDIDEGGDATDDDEQGNGFDDPQDPVVYYLNSNQLIERMPAYFNADGNDQPDGPVDGRDFIESVIAEGVTRFRVERIPTSTGSPQLVDLILELADSDSGETISLQTQVRVGGAL